MKRKRNRFLIISLLVLVMSCTSVFAADSKNVLDVKDIGAVENFQNNEDKIQFLIDKKIIVGYNDGDLKLDNSIKRSEMAQLLVKTFRKDDLAMEYQDSLNPYEDIEQHFWANGIIAVVTKVPSATNGLYLLNGYPNIEFLPNKNLTYNELAKMLVVLVKDDLTAEMANEADVNWPKMWTSWAEDYEIFRGIDVSDKSKAVSRHDALIMFYNALLVRS